MRITNLLIRVAVTGALTAWAFSAMASVPLGTDIYEVLSANDLLERRFEPLIRDTFGTLLKSIDYPLQLRVNDKYAPASLNVYVVSSNAWSKSHIVANDAIRDILKGTQDNAVAVPPDTLVFDARFLADYILNAWNLQIADTQGFAETESRIQLGEPEEQANNVLSSFARLADIYRFRNLAGSTSDKSNRNESTKRVEQISPALTADQGTSRMILFAMAPILYHELGHLHDGTSGAFLDFLQDIAPSLASPKLFEREEAADLFAVDLIKKLTLSLSDFNFSDYEAMKSSVLLMRDTVLFDMFSGFRGLQAEDYFIHLTHNPCSQNELVRSLNFYNPVKVKYALHDFFSLLTTDDFQILREKLLTRIRSGTHAHNFVRGSRLVNALTALGEKVNGPRKDDVMDWYLKFLSAMRTNSPDLLADQATPGEKFATAFQPFSVFYLPEMHTAGLGLRFDELAGSLDFDYKPAVNCPPGICKVGFFKNGKRGFIEVGGSDENLSSVRLVYPLLGDNPRAILDEPDATNADRIAFLQKFLKVTLKVPESSADEVNSIFHIDRLLPTARKCGSIDLADRYKSKLVFVRTINPDFWIDVIVLPSN